MTGAAPIAPGAEIAPRYEVIEHLRRGNALDVYDVWSDARACRCIVKALRPDRLDRPGPRRRLLEEGRLLQRLTHPHIVRAYETLESPLPLVVMETLGGETLSHMIEVRAVELSAEELAHLGLHLASAVRYLHAHGYLHLDLKPSNVIAEGGRAKLLDLSVARRPGRAHAGIGTTYYMAPEQVRGGVLGPAADVWGLGVVLLEAATGEPAFDDAEEDDEDSAASDEPYATDGSDEPYASDEPYESSDAEEESLDESDYPQLHTRAARLSAAREVPAELDALVAACLDPDDARRPDLDEVLATLEPLAGTPPETRRHGLRESASVRPTQQASQASTAR